MPRYVRPRDTPPTTVEAAVDALGTNPLRTAVVRYLVVAGSATSGELAEAMDTSRVNIREHLLNLEKHGVVIADAPLGDRAGKRVQYNIDHAALERHIDQYRAWVFNQEI